jgi:dihydroxyacid dehydratase/phosphogluconate dehydratase
VNQHRRVFLRAQQLQAELTRRNAGAKIVLLNLLDEVPPGDGIDRTRFEAALRLRHSTGSSTVTPLLTSRCRE